AVCWQWATTVGNDYVGPRLLPMIMFPRATIRGIFSIEWFSDENWEALNRELGGMVRRGEVTYQNTIRHAFDAIPAPYRALWAGRAANRGKLPVEGWGRAQRPAVSGGGPARTGPSTVWGSVSSSTATTPERSMARSSVPRYDAMTAGSDRTCWGLPSAMIV